jgi:hypothetical protein
MSDQPTPTTTAERDEEFLRHMESALDAAEGKTTRSVAHMQAMAADFALNGRRLISMARAGMKA